MLELMVALALVAVLVAGIYSSWYSILKGADVAARAAARAQRSRFIKRSLEDSLLCACMFDQNARWYYFLGDSDGGYSTLSFVARLPDSYPRSGKFGGLSTRRVTFVVEGGRLILRQSPLLMEPDQDEMTFPLVLASNVDEFNVKFRDPRDPKSWVNEWSFTNQLPREVLVEVTLRSDDPNAATTKDVLAPVDVAIPAQNVRGEWQSPASQAPAPPQPTNTAPALGPGGPGGTQTFQLGGGQ